MLAVGDAFSNIQEAQEAKNRSVLNEESYKVYKSDSKCHILQYKDQTCIFSIRAAFTKKKGVIITKINAHSCRPTVHYKNRQHSALWFLKEHHCTAVFDNRNISPEQIRSDQGSPKYLRHRYQYRYYRYRNWN